MTDIFHALVLNLHQPPGNLEDLLAHRPWEAKEILYAMDRIPRSLWEYEDVARVHLSLSGTLLETLSHPAFQSRVYGIIDCGSLLWYLQNARIFEVLGTAYYYPVLPLIPREDWEEHLQRWQGIGRHLFNRASFSGFWPPEMGFCMEMIPLLKRMGYRYVLVDSEYIEPVTPMDWQEARYRPHIAKFGGEEIIVVVRDRELSNAQEAGMDANWFLREVQDRTHGCSYPPLVMISSDAENGGWFRNISSGSNFWSAFYLDFLERVRRGESAVQPVFISDYLDRYGVHGEVTVASGAWNTGWHHGKSFIQWTGSQTKRDALVRVAEVSQTVHAARQNAAAIDSHDPELYYYLEEALWRVLRAETSCNFYWDEDEWIHRCHHDLDAACACLDRAWAFMQR